MGAVAGRPGKTMKTMARGTDYAVSSLMPQATLAAEHMLLAGGNAFDAIVAGQAVLGVVQPAANGIGSDAQLLVYACDIGVALIFYELLKPVHRGLALAAATFRLMFAALASANMLNHFAVLTILSGSDDLKVFSLSQLQTLALIFLRLRTVGFDIALVFFGFHWIFAGYLFFKSTFVPHILGAALGLGGVGYLANILSTIFPPVVRTHLFPYIMLPAGLAEVALTLWLMIAGVNVSAELGVSKGNE